MDSVYVICGWKLRVRIIYVDVYRKRICLRVLLLWWVSFTCCMCVSLINRSLPASVHCMDLQYFTCCGSRYTVGSWMQLRVQKI